MNAQSLETSGHADALESAIANYELAARMQMAASDALDIEKESDATKSAYGLGDERTGSTATRSPGKTKPAKCVSRSVEAVQAMPSPP